ncbi:MAG: PilN domain-containing protein [Gemmatimonadota bacterium]
MIEVNLTPESQRGGKRRRRARGPSAGRGFGLPSGRDPWNAALVLCAVIVPVAILALWLTRRSEARGLEERLAVATADSAELADLRAVSDSLTERQRLIEERIDLVEQLDQNRFVWPHLLDEVSRALPQFAWLTGLSQASGPSGTAVQILGRAANPLTITEFVRNLQASPFIGEVRIVGSQREEVEEGLAVQAFTLVAMYERPEGVSTEPLVPSEG